MMSAACFYCRSMLLPFILPAAAGAITFDVGRTARAPQSVGSGILDLIAIAGVFAAIPYALFLIVMLRWLRPTREVDYHRTALSRPW
jgi:hypothetical protein